MNQILLTEDMNSKGNKKQKDYLGGANKTASTKSIVMFFAVAIMIFGIALSGSGAYAFIQNVQEQKNKSVPVVAFERYGNSLKLMIKNDIGIKSIKYAWNNSDYTAISGNNKTELETTINIIPGMNKLNLTVIDFKGDSTDYIKNYEQETEDTTKPIITVSNEDPRIKIVVTDDTEIDHIVYKYGNNDEVTLKASTENPTKLEAYIDNVSAEQVTLYIEAVDKAQNYATFEQQVKGATKPTISVTPDLADPSYLIIKVTDNEGLRTVVFYINDQEYKTDPNIALNTKNFEYKQKVEKGQTNIKVHAYNLSEQVAEFEGVYNY